jgi:DNA processing protein
VQLLRDGARLVRSAEDILEDLQGLRSTPTPRRSERTHPELPFPLAPPVSTIPPKPHAVPVSQGSEPRSPSPPPAPQRTLPPLSGLALQVWETLATASVTDEIAQTLGRTAAELSPTLLRLEMTGRIRRLPGGRIERIG